MAHLHHFPAWTESNPYTNMLHQGVLAAGWRVTGTTTLDALVRALGTLGAGDVFHIQWTQPILKDARDRHEAAAALDRFRAGVQHARGNGVRVLWTVHNKIPHDGSHLGIEIELATFLCEAADRIIQLNAHTVEAVSDLYALPAEKVVTLPHASYVGVYGEPVRRDVARAALGIPPTSPTIGFIGQVRHYKGVSTLFGAVERLSHGTRDLTLILAGKVAPTETDALEADLPRAVRAVRWNGFLPAAEIATWFSAADVIALPYRHILNSGSLYLAATYGRPVVLPEEPHLVAEFGGQPWVEFFDPQADAPAALADAIARALEAAPQTSAPATTFAEGFTMYDMAWGFLAIVEELRGAGHDG